MTKDEAKAFNRQSRIADIMRWRTLDSVVGYEIHLSNNPNHECDICRKLQGEYPKSFSWHGWCDECKCYATPILMDEETRNENERGELKAALTGIPFTPKRAKNEVRHLPPAFIGWLAANCSSWKCKEPPYFVSENRELIKAYFSYGNGNQG